MALVNPLSLLREAKDKEYAIGAFNVYNMETIQAAIEAGEELNSPVILQTSEGTVKYTGVKMIAKMVQVAAEEVDIPVGLHLDHCNSFEVVVQALRHGYTSVMYDGSRQSFNENVKETGRIAEMARAVGVAVEGEIGKIKGAEEGSDSEKGETVLTEPEEAVEFVKETGVDQLAVAIGTAHGVYQGTPHIDYERLLEIRDRINPPIVLHGASGLSGENIKQAIAKGICKVNIATDLKLAFAEQIESHFGENPGAHDLRNYLGKGREAVKKVVKEKIKILGSTGIL